MYIQKIKQSVAAACAAERKDSPKIAAFCIVAGLILAGDAVSVLTHHAGVILWSLGRELSIALFLLVGIVLLYAGAGSIATYIRLASKNSTRKITDSVIAQASALGDADAVFAELEKMPVLAGTDCELRMNSRMIACLSTKSVDCNFIFPMDSVVKAFVTTHGLLVLHFRDGRKIRKCTFQLPDGRVRSILAFLKQEKPDLPISGL